LNNDEQPTHVDLFSGIGGFALAAQWAGFRTVAFCEIDKYCQKILAKNFGAIPYTEIERCGQGRPGRPNPSGEGQPKQSLQVAKNFLADTEERGLQGFTRGQGDNQRERQSDSTIGQRLQRRALSTCKIHANIFDFDGTAYRGCDLLTGGFPCQPYSVAGKRRGAADDRALWPQMFRVIKEARPAWVLGENVPGIIPMELDNVLSDLEGIGYACRSFVIPACAVDARHRRDRLWIIGRFVGNASSEGSLPAAQTGIRSGEESRGTRDEESQRRGCDVPNTNGTGLERRYSSGVCECAGEWLVRESDSLADDGIAIGRRSARPRRGIGEHGEATGNGWRGGRQANGEWLPEPDVGRVAHGIPSRVDRLKGLGNAIVPQVACEILREIRNLI
jgi:DNA (cytosine-5)-methyltransferase 1